MAVMLLPLRLKCVNVEPDSLRTLSRGGFLVKCKSLKKWRSLWRQMTGFVDHMTICVPVKQIFTFIALLLPPDWRNGEFICIAVTDDITFPGSYREASGSCFVSSLSSLTDRLWNRLTPDGLCSDWWLWLESWIWASACSPLTIFHKLLPLVNMVAPTPSVSVTGD